MARPKIIPIRDTLSSLFGQTYLRQLARETGTVKRSRKIDPKDLFWTLVLGFDVGKGRSIAGLRRSYQKTTGQMLAPSSFYKRFTPELAKMLKIALAHALAVGIQVTRALQGPLAEFRDLVLADSTVVRLHDLLARRYPGTRTNQNLSALKLHTVIGVRGAGKHSVKITPERAQETRVLRVGPWVRGHLLVFDLGFFRYHLFSCISRNEGYFLSRLKAGVKPTIVKVNRAHRGHTVELIGRKLPEVIGKLKREVLDVMVQVDFDRRGYRGTVSRGRQILRVVGIRDESTQRYHLYMTNVPVEKLAAEDIGSVYAARWMVELLFRELKTYYRMDDLPSSKAHVVEALLYASVITMVASKRILHAVRRKLKDSADRVRDQRWAAVFQAISQEILLLMTRAPRETGLIARLSSETILREAVDPNAKRIGLLQEVETQTHRYARKAA